MTSLQRLFSTFPGGPPGVGLLLLRLASGVVSLVQGGVIVLGADASPAEWAIGLAVAGAGVALIAGFLTPVACGLAALGGVGLAFHPASAPVLARAGGPLASVLVFIIVVAMSLLGPGAFSLDAWLFGRREVLIRR